MFKDPTSSLSPHKTVAAQISRPAELLRGMSRREAGEKTRSLLEAVRLSGRFAGRLPAELSGGERQRVAIARSLAAGPEVLVCDEITSSLDVVVQAAILDLLDDLRASFGLGLVFITHDLGIAAGVADRVVVMDDGRIVEEGSAHGVLRHPESGAAKRLLAASAASKKEKTNERSKA